VHRPRRGAAVLSEPAPGGLPEEPLPQAWVPRVVNASLALFFLGFLVPIFLNLAGLARSVQVLLVLLAVPLGLLTLGCLVSAVRPGALGRWVRSRRSRST
jgi:threonine/homoserine/homoserine lactone efflux protein